MRDYYYTKSEGMNCVRDSFDVNLAKDFLEWQEATKNFCKSLQKSFENLQYRDQRNGNRKGQSNSFSSGSNENSPANGNKSFQKLFDPQVVENSEKAQLEGGYLKSALYQPISADSSPQLTPSSSREFDPIESMLDQLMDDQPRFEQSRRPPPLYKRSSDPHVVNQTAVKSQYRMKAGQEDMFNSVLYDLDSMELEGFSPIVLEKFARELERKWTWIVEKEKICNSEFSGHEKVQHVYP